MSSLINVVDRILLVLTDVARLITRLALEANLGGLPKLRSARAVGSSRAEALAVSERERGRPACFEDLQRSQE
jgi:hypothetical protein